MTKKLNILQISNQNQTNLVFQNKSISVNKINKYIKSQNEFITKFALKIPVIYVKNTNYHINRLNIS